MQVKYKFKVGNKVKMTLESHEKGLNRSMGCDDAMFVKEFTSWGGPAYYLVDIEGNSQGIWKESEIEPFDTSKVSVLNTEVKKPKEHSAQTHTKTMWALVSKMAPNVIDADKLFTTRSRARRCKFANDLDFLKVAKVTLTWEG